MITRLKSGTTNCIGVCLHFLDILITFVPCSFIMNTHGSWVPVMIRPSAFGTGSLVLAFLCWQDTIIMWCVPRSTLKKTLLFLHLWIRLFVFGILVLWEKRRCPLLMTSWGLHRWTLIFLVVLMLLLSMFWRAMTEESTGLHSTQHYLWLSQEQMIAK